MENKMTVTEFFDVHNLEHLKAYVELNKTGAWPREFWEQIKDCNFQYGAWSIQIANKLADAYIDLTLKHPISENKSLTILDALSLAPINITGTIDGVYFYYCCESEFIQNNNPLYKNVNLNDRWIANNYAIVDGQYRMFTDWHDKDVWKSYWKWIPTKSQLTKLIINKLDEK